MNSRSDLPGRSDDSRGMFMPSNFCAILPKKVDFGPISEHVRMNDAQTEKQRTT